MGFPFFRTAAGHALRFAGVLLLAAGGVAHAACLLTPPAGWDAARSVWEGECKDGRADGLGVLKEFTPERKVKRLLFGSTAQGQLRQGVIDLEGGYIAGQLQDGQWVPSDQAQRNVDYFRTAAQAAQRVSARYQAAGNSASAKFYGAKARQLEQQMD